MIYVCILHLQIYIHTHHYLYWTFICICIPIYIWYTYRYIHLYMIVYMSDTCTPQICDFSEAQPKATTEVSEGRWTCLGPNLCMYVHVQIFVNIDIYMYMLYINITWIAHQMWDFWQAQPSTKSNRRRLRKGCWIGLCSIQVSLSSFSRERWVWMLLSPIKEVCLCYLIVSPESEVVCMLLYLQRARAKARERASERERKREWETETETEGKG